MFAEDLFHSRRAIVTGGGTGIGFAIARQLGRLGASVMICARDENRLKEAAALLREDGINVDWHRVNVRNELEVADLFEGIAEDSRGTDILVNNAGGQFSASALDITPNGFRSVIDLNLVGTWLMSQAFARYVKERGIPGRIVNIVLSVDGGAPGYAHAGAARAGVINLTKTLAVEWAELSINVNSVAPGIVTTKALENYDAKGLNATISALPIKRAGGVSEVAQCVAFLASEAASYITGQTLFVDGGKQLYRPAPT